MSESLLSKDKRCYLCGTIRDLQRHHVYGGPANRKLSEDYGCWVWLCRYHHTGDIRGSKEAVHQNRKIMTFLRGQCQVAFEKKYGHQAFMSTFGRNYL